MIAKHEMSVVISSSCELELQLPAPLPPLLLLLLVVLQQLRRVVFLYIRVLSNHYVFAEIPKFAGFSCFTLKISTISNQNYQNPR